jgi:hypothetical protein
LEAFTLNLTFFFFSVFYAMSPQTNMESPPQRGRPAGHLEVEDFDGMEPLVDTTELLTVKSKRTERRRKKIEKKINCPTRSVSPLLNLPYEILVFILGLLQPSDLLLLRGVNQSLQMIIDAEEAALARRIIALRYPCLAKCFRLPALLSSVDAALVNVLQRRAASASSQASSMASKSGTRSFQHIQLPDPTLICTCLTCHLRWNCLCLIVDFAHWQRNLDVGEPIPMIARGRAPTWNAQLVAAHAQKVRRALSSPLWYARLLEVHLASTTTSIRRHELNKGNRRRRFRMTEEDTRSGTDDFLQRNGPPTMDFPFHRDNYYMLEAFMPNRSWIGDLEAWVYMPADQHDRDLAILAKWDGVWKAEIEGARHGASDGVQDPGAATT